MRRLRMVVEYDGTGFCGFQRQPGRRSVQEVLESRLIAVTEHAVSVVGAGRTDAGVHALGQVAHCDISGRIPAERLARAVNGQGAAEIVVRRVEETDAAFHARFSAVRRTYYYYITPELPTPLTARYVLHEPRLTEDAAERMREALAALMGKRDFRRLSCGERVERPAVRNLEKAAVRRQAGLLRIELTADAFLRSMVRVIVAHLLEIGRGRRDPGSLLATLAGNGGRAPATAPPHGLCLAKVEYADGYGAGLPREALWPISFAENGDGV